MKPFSHWTKLLRHAKIAKPFKYLAASTARVAHRCFATATSTRCATRAVEARSINHVKSQSIQATMLWMNGRITARLAA